MIRAQSHVVGVAIMLGVTVVALGTITAGIGAVFDAHAASADATRVADDLEGALQPVAGTGPREGSVAFSEGELRTANRELRVLRNGSLVRTVEIGALVFTTRDHRVASVAGAVVRGQDSGAWLAREPPIVGSSAAGVLAIGAVKLNTSDVAVSGSGRTTLQTNVSHARRSLGPGRYVVELETAAPAAFESYFEKSETTTSRRDRDGDGVPSLVVTYPGTVTGYLVVHDMRLEVADG
jgi:hypothetical protein